MNDPHKSNLLSFYMTPICDLNPTQTIRCSALQKYFLEMHTYKINVSLPSVPLDATSLEQYEFLETSLPIWQSIVGNNPSHPLPLQKKL